MPHHKNRVCLSLISGISTSLSQFVIRSISPFIEFIIWNVAPNEYMLGKNLSLNLRYDLCACLHGTRFQPYMQSRVSVDYLPWATPSECRWDSEAMNVFYGFFSAVIFYVNVHFFCGHIEPYEMKSLHSLRHQTTNSWFFVQLFNRRYEIPFNFLVSHHSHWKGGLERDLNDIFSQPLISAACPIVRWVEYDTYVRVTTNCVTPKACGKFN